MSEVREPLAVESTGDFVRVQYHDPEEFETLQTPEWARKAAESVVEGSKLRVGKRADSERWIPMEVLIPRPVDATDARRQADEVLQRIQY